MSVGNTLRTRVLGLNPVRVNGDFARSAKTFGFASSVSNMFFTYRMKLRQESIIWAFTDFLGPIQALSLAGRADDYVLRRFNQKFPAAEAKHLKAAQKYLTDLEAIHETADEKALYAKDRSTSKVGKLVERARNLKNTKQDTKHFSVESAGDGYY